MVGPTMGPTLHMRGRSIAPRAPKFFPSLGYDIMLSVSTLFVFFCVLILKICVFRFLLMQ